MSIEFHCEHCGKAIKAPGEMAGKRGKCPGCHNSVYIPSPSEEIEPLTIAPIDRGEEAARLRALEETRALQRRLLGEKDLPPETRRPAAAAAAAAAEPREVLHADAPKGDMENLVIDYAICMADGDLEGAEQIARDIRRDMKAAENVMQRLTIDEVPHAALSKIPRPVLVGFFKQLREKK
jgi:hypothetical protein